MAHTAPLPEPGDLIAGKYHIERALSQGGMGAVYVASHIATKRSFAVKLMRTELAGDAQAEARFMREARLAGAIDHPAIIEVYDVGRHNGFPYMVMKLLEGESLGERIKRGAIEPEKAIALLLPVLDGVAAAHDQGVVHRDLKPDNIFLCAGEPVQPKILDFGISKLVGLEAITQHLTRTGMVLGTPLYMSPEQVRGARDVDARSDVYALGVILYEMLSGVLPYQASNYADLVLQIVTGKPKSVRERNPVVGSELEAIVSRAMAVEREDRHPDVRAFARELEALQRRGLASSRRSLSSSPSTVTPFTAEAEASSHSVSRLRAAVALTALAVVALGLVAFGLWRSGPATPAQAGAVSGPALPEAKDEARPQVQEQVQEQVQQQAQGKATSEPPAPHTMPVDHAVPAESEAAEQPSPEQPSPKVNADDTRRNTPPRRAPPPPRERQAPAEANRGEQVARPAVGTPPKPPELPAELRRSEQKEEKAHDDEPSRRRPSLQLDDDDLIDPFARQ